MTRGPVRIGIIERVATVPMESAIAAYAVVTAVLNAFGYGTTWHMLVVSAPLWMAHILGIILGVGGVLTFSGIVAGSRGFEIGGLIILGSAYTVRLLAATLGHGWWWPEFSPTYFFNTVVAIACIVRARQLLGGDTLVRARTI